MTVAAAPAARWRAKIAARELVNQSAIAMTSAQSPPKTRAPRVAADTVTPIARHNSMAKHEPAALTSPNWTLMRVACASRRIALQPAP
jgi:hypothetical protein